MGYFDYLKGLLAPLGLYELDSGAGSAELRNVGVQLDETFERFEELSCEVIPSTADGFGLSNFEALFPYRPSYITLEDRRRAVAALLKIRNGYFSVAALCDTLAGCGINAVVAEGDSAMTVVVSFPDNRGVPDDIDTIKQKIELILPCHLGVEYLYIYTTWGEIMAGLGSWQELEQRCPTWKAFESFKA